MKRALDPYLSRIPEPDELASVATTELQRIVAECREIESATAAEIAETLDWARDVRFAAEQALEQRK